MRRLGSLVLVFVVACGGWFPLLPDTRTPADRAHAMARSVCASPKRRPPCPLALARRGRRAGLLHRAFGQRSGDTSARRAPTPRPHLNVSAQALQRTLECHQARVTLGDSPEIADDPYVLPEPGSTSTSTPLATGSSPGPGGALRRRASRARSRAQLRAMLSMIAGRGGGADKKVIKNSRSRFAAIGRCKIGGLGWAHGEKRDTCARRGRARWTRYQARGA